MKDFHVYKDIEQRTKGEIYFGIVGPVRSGKSTFIRRFMEEMVIPYMEDGPDKQRSRDELPQAASGKSIMTTEPKFIPTEAARVKMEDGAQVKIRLVDCVGFMVPGAVGHEEGEKERYVHTPWFDYDIPFTKAAEIGTRKVIEEHSTIGVVVTTDGSVTELPREAYMEAEEKTIRELKGQRKPFLVVLNTAAPGSAEAISLARQIEEKNRVTVLPMNCAAMTTEDIQVFLQTVLLEFPVSQVDYELPGWLEALPLEHPVKAAMIGFARELLERISCMKDARQTLDMSAPESVRRFGIGQLDLATGRVSYEIVLKDEVYFRTVSEYAGLAVEDEASLMNILREYASLREQYRKVQSAMESVSQKGYGVVTPQRSQIMLDDPVVVRHGNRYGVRMKAAAPSVHMIRSLVETEIAPIVGSEAQAKDLVDYIQEAAKQGEDGIWSTNIFGKSIEQIVEDGMNAKISQMTDACQQKLQDALKKIINDSNGGMICIII